jgi:beta-xylosidase
MKEMEEKMRKFKVFLSLCAILLLASCKPTEDTSNEKNEGIVMQDGFMVDQNEPEVLLTKDGKNISGADPHVFQDDDGTYYMYVTGYSNEERSVLPTYKSEDFKTWKRIGSAIVDKPYVYTGGDNDETNQYLFNFWSPDVYEFNGKYYLFVAGPALSEYTTDYVPSQLNISTYVAESDHPAGPFEKFVLIKPRQENIKAPHSVIQNDSYDAIYTPGYEFYNTIRIDFHLFEDPNTDKTYFSFTGYGNPAKKTENGNHVIITELKNPEFIGEGSNPGFYYDYVPESHIHASNPLDWPEFGDTIKTNLDREGNVWKPTGMPFSGHPRGVTEAPSLIYHNGWYQLYFSVNTWDSPYYQIVTIFTKELEDLDVTKRQSLSDDQLKIGRFQLPSEFGTTWTNYGSGGIYIDQNGTPYMIYHQLPQGSVRNIVMKEIRWWE